MSDTKQFCTFYVDQLYFGVDVRQVQEVIRQQEMTRVPLSPNTIGGLINLRGQIITAIDLRQKLELAERPKDKPHMNVVIHNDGTAASFLVDEISDVVTVESEAYEPAPETLSAVARELVQGVYKLKHQLLLVLNPQRALAV